MFLCFARYKTHSQPVRTFAAVVCRFMVFQLLTMSVATRSVTKVNFVQGRQWDWVHPMNCRSHAHTLLDQNYSLRPMPDPAWLPRWQSALTRVLYSSCCCSTELPQLAVHLDLDLLLCRGRRRWRLEIAVDGADDLQLVRRDVSEAVCGVPYAVVQQEDGERHCVRSIAASQGFQCNAA